MSFSASFDLLFFSFVTKQNNLLNSYLKSALPRGMHNTHKIIFFEIYNRKKECKNCPNEPFLSPVILTREILAHIKTSKHGFLNEIC